MKDYEEQGDLKFLEQPRKNYFIIFFFFIFTRFWEERVKETVLYPAYGRRIG